MVKRILNVILCSLCPLFLCACPDAYPPAHIYDHYNYDFSKFIFLGPDAQPPVHIKRIEIYKLPYRNVSWPTPEELPELPLRLRTESQGDIALILKGMREDTAEIHWGASLFRYYALVFYFTDGSMAMYPFELSEKVIDIYTIRKKGSIYSSHASPTIFSMLAQRGAITPEDMNLYSTPRWWAWLKEKFTADGE